MYMRWALVSLMVTLAVTSTSDSEDDTGVADIENAINLEPTPTVAAYNTASNVSLMPRREGGGGGKGSGGGRGGKAKAAGGGGRGGGGGDGTGDGGKGGGHQKNSGASSGSQNKVAANTGAGIKKLAHQNNSKEATSAFPSGRWKQTRTCIHRTGSSGNTYATLCANPGQSPTNIHPPKVTSKPSQPPKVHYTGCSISTMANGILTIRTHCTKVTAH